VTPEADPAGRSLSRLTHRRPSSSPPGSPARPSGLDPPSSEPLVIDCDVCSMRGLGCGDCMVTVLLGGPPYGVALDEAEQRAIDALAAAGLIPPLRMVQSVDPISLDYDGQT
jgi:hypothetical protein